MMLVLLLGYGTMTRTESIASANYRDYVASKYIAQGALNRAIAEIERQYIGNSSNYNAGLSPFYSCVWPTDDISNSSIPAVTRSNLTDIERVIVANTQTPITQPIPDGKPDYVVLAGQGPDYSDRPQWIGVKDTNGVFIGREAFLVTSAAIDINTSGNLVPNAFGHINARGRGFSVAEINLPAALMATDPNTWDYSTAEADTKEILQFRYGGKMDPGDGSTEPRAATDGRDNNGNFIIDDPAESATATPYHALLYSEGVTPDKTVQQNFRTFGDDRSFTDLKQLKDSSNLTNAAARFTSAFSQVQRTFVTQSAVPVFPLKVPPTSTGTNVLPATGCFNLNDTNSFPDPLLTQTDQESFYEALYPLMVNLGVPTRDSRINAQLTANIVSYASQMGDALLPQILWQPFNVSKGTAPLNGMKGTNMVGLTRSPLINQVQLDYIVTLRLNEVVPASPEPGKVSITLLEAKEIPHTELWYPFTEGFYNSGWTNSVHQPLIEFFATNKVSIFEDHPGSLGLTHIADINLACSNRFVDGASLDPNKAWNTWYTGTSPKKPNFPINPISLIKLTNFDLGDPDRRFYVYDHISPIANQNNFKNGSAFAFAVPVGGNLTYADAPSRQDITLWNTNAMGWICVSNIHFQVNLKQFDPKTWAVTNNALLDVANTTFSPMPLFFPASQLYEALKPMILNTTPGGLDGQILTFTNVISFALNDPRVKNWQIEYAGTQTSPLPVRNHPNPAGTANMTSPKFQWPKGNTSLGCLNYPYMIPNTNVDLKVDIWSTSQSQVTNRALADLRLFTPDAGEDKLYVPDQSLNYTNTFYKGIAPKTFWVKHKRMFTSPVEVGRVHAGQPWRTVHFAGGTRVTDNALLDHLTIVNNGVKSYMHGRININDRPNRLPTWAALFCGMPYENQYMRDHGMPPVYFDLLDTDKPKSPLYGHIDPSFPYSRAFGEIIGRAAGTFTHMGALTSIPEFGDLTEYGQAPFAKGTPPWNQMRTNEDQEDMLEHIFNLIAPKAQGNLFTIWAWGQALTGPPWYPSADVNELNKKRVVSGETLIVAQVRPSVYYDDNDTNPDKLPTSLTMRVIYYRFNPDLEMNPGW